MKPGGFNMKPLTRKEMLLDGAAKGKLDTFKSATREEVFAKRALANTGGSGGNNPFFFITGECNDEMLVTLHCTYNDIVSAYNEGKILVFMGKGLLQSMVAFCSSVRSLGDVDVMEFNFGSAMCVDKTLSCITIRISPERTFVFHTEHKSDLVN